MFLQIAFFVLLAVSSIAAQRGSYAGTGPIGKPGLASRFRDDSESTTAASLSNRLGEGGSTERIPVDARGDHDLVHRLNQWPRENRPFWLINAEHIEAQRNRPQGSVFTQSRFGDVNDNGVIPAKPPVSRSPFAN